MPNDADWTDTAAGYFQPDDKMTKDQKAAMDTYNNAIQNVKDTAKRTGALSPATIAARQRADKALGKLSATGWDNSSGNKSRVTGRDRRKPKNGTGMDSGGESGSALNPNYP